MNELEYGYYCTTALNFIQSCKCRPMLASDIHTSFHHLCSIWWNDGKDGLNYSVSGLRWWLFDLEMSSPLLLLHDSTLHSTIWLAIPPLFFVNAHGLGCASLLAHFAIQSRFTQSLLLHSDKVRMMQQQECHQAQGYHISHRFELLSWNNDWYLAIPWNLNKKYFRDKGRWASNSIHEIGLVSAFTTPTS